MSIIYAAKRYKGYGKQNYYYYEYRLEGTTVSRYKIHEYKFFDGKENEWNRDESFVESWDINDPSMPDWLKRIVNPEDENEESNLQDANDTEDIRRLSASSLGRLFGLSPQEMNHYLKEIGILDGTPGNYSLTTEGEKYGYEQSHQRGNGGYQCYNPSWITKSFDKSIVDIIHITPEERDRIIEETAAERKRRKDEKEAASNAYWAMINNKSINRMNDVRHLEGEKGNDDSITVDENPNNKTAYIIGSVIVTFVAGVICYKKFAPRIKKWWQKRKTTLEEAGEENEEADDIEDIESNEDTEEK